MFSKVFRDIARPQWFAVINIVKRSLGLSVPEMAEKLGMSYMGVKKHCVALEKLGYLVPWRRPKEVGRPEKIYRLTEKANALFPGIGDEVCLEVLAAADQIEPNAAEKLLFSYFQKLGESYAKKIGGEAVVDKAVALAKCRDRAGHMSECRYESGEGLRIVEYHNPLQAIFDKYPTVERMEAQMFERLLGAPVSREVFRVSGLTCFVFRIETL